MSDIIFGSNAESRGPSLWMPPAVEGWLKRRRAYRARLAHAEWDLLERYGDASYAIARSSARQAGEPAMRRFWGDVASALRQRGLR